MFSHAWVVGVRRLMLLTDPKFAITEFNHTYMCVDAIAVTAGYKL
jgi:hypothetical protein